MQPELVKRLRIALPTLFALFAILLVVSWRDRAPDVEALDATDESRGADRAELISYEFEDTHLVGSRIVAKIRAKKTVGFESGWYRLEEARLTFFSEDGGSYELDAPRVELQSKTREARADGGVRVTSSDGLDLRTEAIVFDGTTLENEIPVRFTMPPWRGRANGVDLDVERASLRLHGGVNFAMQREGEADPFTLEASEANLNRGSGETRFMGEVKLQQRTDIVRSDELIVVFDADRTQLVGMEGRGNVHMIVAPDSAIGGVNVSEMPGNREITAAAFDVRVDGDGEIRAITARSGEGKRVRARLEGAVERSVEADLMTVNFTRKRAESIEASGGVRIVETGDRAGAIEAERTVMTIDQRNGQVSHVMMDGNVRFSNAEATATSTHAIFNVGSDLVRLTGSVEESPTIESGSYKVKAGVIELEPGSSILRARDKVVAELSGGGSANLFGDESSPVFVNSNSMVVREEDDLAAFSGSVRAWQGRNTLFADDIQITNGGNDVIARGKVRADLVDPNAPAGSPIEIEAPRLRVDRLASVIELDGGVVVRQQGRVMRAEEARLFLNESNRLERMTANGRLIVEEPATRRSATGDSAVYELSTGMISVDGNPATLNDARGSVAGRRIVFDLTSNRVRVERGDSQTEATYNQAGGSDDPSSQ